MKFKKLGGTDLKVSLICLGTMTWGEQNTQEEGFKQMDYALETLIFLIPKLIYRTTPSGANITIQAKPEL